MLFSGNFRQFPPVMSGGSRDQVPHGFVRYSALYAGFRILRLTENMRLSSMLNDPNEKALEFQSYLFRLLKVRLEKAKESMVKMPESVHKVLDIDTLCSAVFHGLELNSFYVNRLTTRAILSAKISMHI